jgi:hypothetical protein
MNVYWAKSTKSTNSNSHKTLSPPKIPSVSDSKFPTMVYTMHVLSAVCMDQYARIRVYCSDFYWVMIVPLPERINTSINNQALTLAPDHLLLFSLPGAIGVSEAQKHRCARLSLTPVSRSETRSYFATKVRSLSSVHMVTLSYNQPRATSQPAWGPDRHLGLFTQWQFQLIRSCIQPAVRSLCLHSDNSNWPRAATGLSSGHFCLFTQWQFQLT